MGIDLLTTLMIGKITCVFKLQQIKTLYSIHEIEKNDEIKFHILNMNQQYLGTGIGYAKQYSVLINPVISQS
jgi:hypothetical protein